MNMNKFNSKAIAFLLVILLVLGTAPAAFADEVTSTEPSTGIIYKGKLAVDRWFYRDVDTTYTATDLFKNPGFKSVMPGDELVQDFIVKNESPNSIKLFMEVLPHGEGNAISEGVNTTTPQMVEFLNQLSMQVTAGEGEQAKVLFDIPKGQLGTYYGKQELGTLWAGYGTELHVKLDVPITLDNRYALDLTKGVGIGEIDFRFIIEERRPSVPEEDPVPPKPNPEDPEDPVTPDEPIDDPDVPLDGPDEPTVIPGEPVEDIPDPKVPLGDAPKTGDNTKILPLMLLMIAALAGLVTTRKKLN